MLSTNVKNIFLKSHHKNIFQCVVHRHRNFSVTPTTTKHASICLTSALMYSSISLAGYGLYRGLDYFFDPYGEHLYRQGQRYIGTYDLDNLRYVLASLQISDNPHYQYNFHKLILEIIRHGSLESIKMLYQEGYYNVPKTLFLLCCYNCRLDAVEWLLSLGVVDKQSLGVVDKQLIAKSERERRWSKISK